MRAREREREREREEGGKRMGRHLLTEQERKCDVEIRDRWNSFDIVNVYISM